MIKNANFDFFGKRKIFFTISISLFVLIALIGVFLGVKMDIQFTGGSIISYAYEGTINEAELQKTVESTIDSHVKISFKDGVSGKDSFDISLTDTKGLSAEKLNALTAKMDEVYGEQVELLSNSSVDPIIGKEFLLKSLVAVLFAALVLIIYIGFRFKKISGWSAGVMAVVALLHDVIIVFGTFVIFRMPLDYNFIAVILTILGYSINDTIVVYDRIRENKRTNKNMPLPQLLNKSLNETLARTINTTISTMISMVVVSVVSVAMGVSSIVSFSFPMIIGMLSGTYSTLFIAGPLWVMWRKYEEKKNGKSHSSKKD